MNNKLIIYPFENYLYNGFVIDKLVYTPSVLDLLLTNDNGSRVKISFDWFYDFRVIDEGDAINMLNCFNGELVLGIYTLTDSQYLKWFHEQSVMMHLKENVVHYIIVTVNDIVEVLSCEKPLISRI